MNDEQILQFHPILHANDVKIHWHGYIKQISNKGDHESRYLVISSCALFILNKRTFPSGFKLILTIPIVNITAITLTSDYLSVDTKEFSFFISHAKINELSALLIAIKTQVCGSCEFRASTQLKLSVADIKLDIIINEPIATKFASECVAINTPLRIDQVNQTSKMLLEDQEIITFTPSLAASALMPAIIGMLKGKSSYKTIILKDLGFMTFFDHFANILKESESVDKIVFYRTSFLESNLDVPSEFFEKDVKAPIHHLEFKGCDLSNPRFREFFYNLAKLKSNIESITIDHVNFVQSSIESIFYSIFDAVCFRSLTSVVINKVNMPEIVQMFTVQLTNCDWFLKNKTFKKLVIQNTQLNINFLLNAIMIFDCGLEELRLAGDIFTTPISPHTIESFQQLRVLDLSSITTTSEAMISLFETIAKVPGELKSLNVSSLKMKDSNTREFYSKISDLKLKGLSTLVWDGNIVEDELVPQFMKFLSNQTDLIDLSISDCIFRSKENAQKISDLVGTLKLERFVMVATERFAFNEEITEVIKSLINKGTVNSLDITGHHIRESGIELLSKFVTRGAEGIAFGNTRATDAEVLRLCLKEITKSSIKFAVWPSKDVKVVITKHPLPTRDDMIKKFSKLKKKFETKFHVELEEVSAEPDSLRIRRMSLLPHFMRQNSDNALPHMDIFDIKPVAEKEDKTIQLLGEVIGEDSVNVEKDPLVLFYNNLIKEINLQVI